MWFDRAVTVLSVVLLAVAGGLLAGELFWLQASRVVAGHAESLSDCLFSARIHYQEFKSLDESKAQMALVQGVAEQLIDSTTDATREAHQKIADVPFTVLESIPVTRDAAKVARGVHDVTSTGVYAAVSLVNKGFGKGLRSLLSSDAESTKKPERLPDSESSKKTDD